MTTNPSDVYTLAVGGWTQTQPDQEIGQFGSVSITANIDGGTDLTFDVPGRSPTAAALSELDTDVWVFKADVAFVRARVIAVEQTWDADGNDLVNVTAVDYKRLLNARMVQSNLDFVNTAQSAIVWGLIDHTQGLAGGDLGLVQGTLESGYLRDRSYELGENIGDLISKLQKVIDGPYVVCNADLTVDAFHPSNFPTRTVPIELGATARSLRRGSGAAQFANSVFVDGDSQSTVPVSVATATVGTDPRGRWERAAGFPNVTEQATLTEKANGLLESTVSPVAQWSVELDVGRYLSDADFTIGDYVTILQPPTTVAPIGAPATEVAGQVMSLSLSLSADGASDVSVEVIET